MITKYMDEYKKHYGKLKKLSTVWFYIHKILDQAKLIYSDIKHINGVWSKQ